MVLHFRLVVQQNWWDDDDDVIESKTLVYGLFEPYFIYLYIIINEWGYRPNGMSSGPRGLWGWVAQGVSVDYGEEEEPKTRKVLLLLSLQNTAFPTPNQDNGT